MCNALTAAAYSWNSPPVPLLVESGAELNAKSNVTAAAYYGKETLWALLNSEAEVNTILQCGEFVKCALSSSLRGDAKVVKLLLESGAVVNAQLQATAEC